MRKRMPKRLAAFFNLVSEDPAIPMNYSAAELERDESEFELAGLSYCKSKLVDTPVIKDARDKMGDSCTVRYPVDVGSFSIVVGKVKAKECQLTCQSVQGWRSS